MDAKTQAELRKLLFLERERILNNSKRSLAQDLAVSSDDLPDETDLAAQEIQQNLTFNMRDRDRRLLESINEALMRMENGVYGICEETEEPIEVSRLRAVPWTTVSLAGAELRDLKKRKFA